MKGRDGENECSSNEPDAQSLECFVNIDNPLQLLLDMGILGSYHHQIESKIPLATSSPRRYIMVVVRNSSFTEREPILVYSFLRPQIFGLATLIAGIIFKLGWDEVREAFVDNSEKVDLNLQYAGDTVAYSAIIFGSFIVMVSLAGCIGACCRVKCLLTVYAIIVILLLIGEIIVVALAAHMGSDSRNEISEGLKDSLKNYYENSTESKSRGFSALFSTLKCCGVEDYKTDFTTNTPGLPFYPARARDLTKYPLKIPITCCQGVDYEAAMDAKYFDKHSKCLTSPDEDNAYVKGCLDSIEDEIDSNKSVLIGVGVTIFVIEILVVVMSFFLCCRDDD
ncbi:hypothetical protein RRG08_009392 [Elysia crispata]|uniref:Tetraspanin n=1 Tax=Elysia crispata TaxID=231223 RepID=A0AAE1AI62_9GAST|nr:hypothetical protein RRG08_009392 [Elysia crispata]